MRIRRKTNAMQAVTFNGYNTQEVAALVAPLPVTEVGGELRIAAAEGTMVARDGYVVAMARDKQPIVIRPDLFQELYEIIPNE